MFQRQDQDLATELRAAVTRIEYTSMWRGSASIGAGDYCELYHVDPKSGLVMIYVWISQYVVIETGTDPEDRFADAAQVHRRPVRGTNANGYE